MARALWGKVSYRNAHAGLLQREPSGRYSFVYDPEYVSAGGPPIAHSLPIRATPHYSEGQLHPFFDNLVAEGWLANAQARATGVGPDDRFALLLAFGLDCAGAVSVIDLEPDQPLRLDVRDRWVAAALAARASISGMQPKLLVIETARGFRPASADERSSHIAKLPSGQGPDLLPLEFLTTLAVRKLLPSELVVKTVVAEVQGIASEALIVRRFDRTLTGTKRHFEEFNQLMCKPSSAKYDAAYEDMARFIRRTPGCIPAEAEKLFRRVLACILAGNTDAHLKNFAMFHTREGLRLTPCYDLVASAYYPQFRTVALSVGGAEDLAWSALRPKHIVAFGKGCGLGSVAIMQAVDDLGKRLGAATSAVEQDAFASRGIREGLVGLMVKRWNGTFASIGQLLSKRRAAGARR